MWKIFNDEISKSKTIDFGPKGLSSVGVWEWWIESNPSNHTIKLFNQFFFSIRSKRYLIEFNRKQISFYSIFGRTVNHFHNFSLPPPPLLFDQRNHFIDGYLDLIWSNEIKKKKNKNVIDKNVSVSSIQESFLIDVDDIWWWWWCWG